ncbi:MAG: Clp protease N-terminal domain-containing protein, partial [Planctomycetota bacterium]
NIKFDRADVDTWLESKKVFPRPGGKKMSDLRTLPWTPLAQQVMKESEKDKAGCVGTGQILLSIIEVKECLGAVILRNLKIDKQKIREVHEQLHKDPNVEVESRTTGNKQNLTDIAQKAIQRASEEAIRLGHEYVGAEHLLAAVLLVDDGWGHRILTELGVTLEQIRTETAKLIVSRPVQTE